MKMQNMKMLCIQCHFEAQKRQTSVAE